MKLNENIYIGIFIFVVFTATVLLNYPKNQPHLNTNAPSKQQQLIENYNIARANEFILKPSEHSTEVGGELEFDFQLETNELTLFWNRMKKGKNTYQILLNNHLIKTVHSNGEELYHMISYTKFKAGTNKITIKGTLNDHKVTQGELYLHFEKIHKEDGQITISE